MERFNFLFLVAGLGFFGLAFVVMGWLPIAQYSGVGVVTMEQLSQDVPYQFVELARDFPEEFAQAFDTTEPTPEAFAAAIEIGRKSYIAEACWHCHSQQIRRRDPNTLDEVGHDISRWASDTNSESVADEYYNEMNYPHLFGTRRVGPDLIRESGRHSNDWHLAHFWDPPTTSPYTIMPRYGWFFAPISVPRPGIDNRSSATPLTVAGDVGRAIEDRIWHLSVTRGGASGVAEVTAEDRSPFIAHAARQPAQTFVVQAGTPVDIGTEGLTVTFDFLRPLSAGDSWEIGLNNGWSPNERGLGLVAYMQWLGSWHTQFAPSRYENLPDIEFDDAWYPPLAPRLETEPQGDGYDDEEGYGDEQDEDYGESDDEEYGP